MKKKRILLLITGTVLIVASLVILFLYDHVHYNHSKENIFEIPQTYDIWKSGDTIRYEKYYFIVTDTLSKGLTFNNDVEIKTWLEILTQPVHDGTKHIYNITRFLSDIFKSINNSGIYFESVQAAGHNIVCFKPSLFQLVEYSEKIYTATKIKYIYQQVEDSIREYSTKNNGKHIDFYDAYESKEKKKKFEYLNNWIENERLKQAAEDSITMAANSFFT